MLPFPTESLGRPPWLFWVTQIHSSAAGWNTLEGKGMHFRKWEGSEQNFQENINLPLRGSPVHWNLITLGASQYLAKPVKTAFWAYSDWVRWGPAVPCRAWQERHSGRRSNRVTLSGSRTVPRLSFSPDFSSANMLNPLMCPEKHPEESLALIIFTVTHHLIIERHSEKCFIRLFGRCETS